MDLNFKAPKKQAAKLMSAKCKNMFSPSYIILIEEARPRGYKTFFMLK